MANIKRVNFLILILAALATFCSFLPLGISQENDKKVFMCYWGTWSLYRPQPYYHFNTTHLPLDICTHIIYSFAGLNRNTNAIMSLDPYLDFIQDECQYNEQNVRECGVHGQLSETVKLKEQNPNLKVLIAIGGWSQGSNRFSVMANDTTKRSQFIDSVLSFINKYSLDGLDFDWEFPVSGGDDNGAEYDRENFVDLLFELRKKFDDLQTGGRVLYLTAAVAAAPRQAARSYDIPGISKHLDYINLMAYDFKMYLEDTKRVGHHSPVYPKEDESPDDKDLTISAAVDFYISEGAPPEKLTLGVGSYGKTYTLKNVGDSFYDEAAGPGPAQHISQSPGTIYYNEICEIGKDLKYYFDYGYFIPFATRDTYWIGYDDEDSVMEKVDFAERKGLGGMMLWTIDQDDFHNTCEGWYEFAIAGTVKLRMDYWENKRAKNKFA